MDSPIGYDASFLSIKVALPHPADHRETIDLTYPHFSVVFQPSRRLAAATGVNINGGALLDLARADDWHFDPRLPEADQAGPGIYDNNDLDRGHLVRRRDPVWGDPEVAAAANEATFVYANAAPQAAIFNQGPMLWAGLEDHVLDYASAYRQRISVFTGPVLADNDPEYRGLQVPRLFWKIAVWTRALEGGESPALSAAGFVLDQSAALDMILNRERPAVEQPPPLMPYLTYQVPVADIRDLTGLDVGKILSADIFKSHSTAWGPSGQRSRWMPLNDKREIRLTPRST